MEFCDKTILKSLEFCDIIYTEVKKMSRLRRKIDQYLIDWKNDKNKMPLIVKGARQIGKTDSIKNFAKNNYKYLVEINFAIQKQYLDIFDKGFEVDTILKNITFKNPNFKFVYFKPLSFLLHFSYSIFLFL